MVSHHSCHDTQLFNTFNMNVTLMVIISLVGAVSRLNIECSYLHILCGTIYFQDNSDSIEKKISVIYQNINENNCQLHLFALKHTNDSHCMTSCRLCKCDVTLTRSLLNGCVSVLYFLYVILLFQILNSNIFGLNQLIFVMTLSTSQQDKISQYKIWLTCTICFENAQQNIINSVCVSSSRKFDTIGLFTSIASWASIVLSFVGCGLEYAQIYLNYEIRLFFTNCSTLLINGKKIQQRKISKISNLKQKCKISNSHLLNYINYE